MLYCSDCDKDVEFKSLDVSGMLTHCCVECGSTNLFRNKKVYEAGVKLNREKEERRNEIKGCIKSITGFVIFFLVFAISFIFIGDKITEAKKRKADEKKRLERLNRDFSKLKVGDKISVDVKNLDDVKRSKLANTYLYLEHYEGFFSFKGIVTLIRKDSDLDFLEINKDGNSKKPSLRINYYNIEGIYNESEEKRE